MTSLSLVFIGERSCFKMEGERKKVVYRSGAKDVVNFLLE